MLFRSPDTTQVRDYTYDDGLEGQFESTLNLGKYITAAVVYHYYFMRMYSSIVKKDYTTSADIPGNNSIGILEPSIAVHLYKGLSLGFEHYIYYNNRYPNNYPVIHSVKTEEKIFVQLYLEDKQRRGHYQ